MPEALSGRRLIYFAWLLVMALAQVAAGVVAALAVSKMFEHLSHGQAPSALSVSLFAVAIVTLGGILAGKRWIAEALGLSFAADVRLALLRSVFARAVNPGATRSHGSTLLPFVGDLTALRKWVADGVARGVAALLVAAVTAACIALLSPTLAVSVIATFGLALALMLALTAPLYAAAKRQRQRRGRLTSMVSERIGASSTVRACGAERRELTRVSQRIEVMNQASLQRARISGAMRAVSAIGTSALVLVSLLNAHALLVDGTLTLPHLVGLLSLIGMFGTSLSDLGLAAELYVPARIARQRIISRLTEQSPPPARSARRRGLAALTVTGLSLSASAQPFSAALKRGAIISIEGPSGSAKSQLLTVLAGLREPAAGQVFWRGRPVAQLSSKRRRREVGFASLLLPLIKGSVRRNVSYRLREGESEQSALWSAALGIDHLLSDQAAPIGERGEGLSNAERNALIVARALVGQPPFLLLDDVDAALDEHARSALVETLRSWPGVVVMAAQTHMLRGLATQRWHVDDTGIVEQDAADKPEPDSSVLPLHYAGVRHAH